MSTSRIFIAMKIQPRSCPFVINNRENCIVLTNQVHDICTLICALSSMLKRVIAHSSSSDFSAREDAETPEKSLWNLASPNRCNC